MSVSVTSSVRSQYGLAALSAAARFWFAVMVAGQLVFATAVAAFYGRSAIRGDFDAWNRTMTHGYVSGEPLGNAAVAVHLAGAVVIILGGAIQLLPGLRKQAPAVHRWNGRAYLAAAVVTSVAGLIMIWTRGTVGDVGAHLGQSLDGVLILVFAALALRAALARDFRAHARWAMRLYLVVSAALFIRAGLILGVPLRFFTLMSFGQYLVPLAMLELYWRARDGGAVSRTAMAACLSVVTLALSVGLAGTSVFLWWPQIRLAYTNEVSIAEPLSKTISTKGVDEAVRQYHVIRTTVPAGYDFEEQELNRLGYTLLHAGRTAEAIRVFELNVEAYPRSGNVYDSLAEASMDHGDRLLAIKYYRQSLAINPSNSNAVQMLKTLRAP